MADDRWPSWSARGDRLMFHRLVDRGAALRVLDRRSGTVRTVADASESPGQGSFDPHAGRVVYSAAKGGKLMLRIRELGSGSVRTIDSGPGDSAFPRWSPDGRRIAFAYNPGDHWDLATIQPDGSDLKIWTRSLRNARSLNGLVDWSPDSRRIVFHASTEPFEANIYVLDTATGKIQNLTDDAWFSEAPAWTPEGDAVAFMSTRGGGWTWGFFRLSLDDGKVSQIAAPPDYTERNFIRFSRDGWMTWSSYGEDGVEYVEERSPDGRIQRNAAVNRWARWPSYSADRGKLLYTEIEHRVEYWVADNVVAADSPLLKPIHESSTRAAARCGPEDAEPHMSPLRMQHR